MGESTFNVQGAETREAIGYKKRKADLGDLDAKSSQYWSSRVIKYSIMWLSIHELPFTFF